MHELTLEDDDCLTSVQVQKNKSILTPRVEEGRPRMIPYRLQWGRAHNAIDRFDSKLAQNKGCEFRQTNSNAVVLFASMPTDCLVKVVRRKLDDTAANVAHQKKAPEPKKVPRVVVKHALPTRGDVSLAAQGD